MLIHYCVRSSATLWRILGARQQIPKSGKKVFEYKRQHK